MSGAELQFKELGTGDIMQDCPLCGMSQQVLVTGIHTEALEEDRGMVKVIPIPGTGYSFCGCQNIFYTNWSNINQNLYDIDYFDRYNKEVSIPVFVDYATYYFPLFKEFNPNIKRFAEIGCINDVFLDCAKEQGWETLGIDINEEASRHSNHKCVIGDVDMPSTTIKIGKCDVIWASHIFEHFKDPLNVAKNLYNYNLNTDGLLFVSMPDPWFINHVSPKNWPHWVVREHHILWDMDSFIDALEDIGYKCVYRFRNVGVEFPTNGDYHLVFQKVTI